jgi:tetratricopeptide (TPR) repeat protein
MYYLRGRELIGERTERSLREALKVFETAIDLDPGFAKAHAGLAEVYTFMFHDGYEPYEQTAPKAELAVKKALQLDPELAEAHVTLANVDFQEDDVAGTEREARRALELNPSLAEAYYVLANIAFLRAEQEEGMKFMETAYRLDPVMPRYVDRVGMFYFYLGREAEALQHWEKTEQFVPAGTYRNMSEYYVSKGDFAKAKEFHAKAESIEPTHRWGTWMKGYIAAKTGDREGALDAIKEIEERWLGATSLNEVAFVYFALGDLDSYFTYITRAIDSHSVRFAYVMYCPLFVGAREDPRYQDLVKRLKKLAELPPR